jgi:small ligand-binding sensory domain FIST
MPATRNSAVSRIVLSTFDEAAVQNASRACRDELGAPADIVFAFVTPDFAGHLGEFIELVQVYAHTPRVVGCSASGVIGTGQEDEEVCGFSLLALSLPRTSVNVSEVSGQTNEVGAIPPGTHANGADRSDDEDPDSVSAAADGPSEDAPALTLFHPARLDIEAWLQAWNASFPEAAVIGGVASGTANPDEIFLFTEAGPSEAAGLLVRLNGGVRIEAVVSQGCRPIGRAEPITEGTHNVVARLGGEAAYAVLHEAVEGLMREGTDVAPGSIHAGLAVSEYIEDYRRGDFLVRNVLGADAGSGRVQIGAPVDIGRTLQFQFRDRDAADDDLRSQSAALRDRHPGEPFAGLLFSCAGRGRNFFGVANHDAGLLAEVFGAHALAGFFCNGEIGPLGIANYLHGYTASAALFYDDRG